MFYVCFGLPDHFEILTFYALVFICTHDEFFFAKLFMCASAFMLQLVLLE